MDAMDVPPVEEPLAEVKSAPTDDEPKVAEEAKPDEEDVMIIEDQTPEKVTNIHTDPQTDVAVDLDANIEKPESVSEEIMQISEKPFVVGEHDVVIKNDTDEINDAVISDNYAVGITDPVEENEPIVFDGVVHELSILTAQVLEEVAPFDVEPAAERAPELSVLVENNDVLEVFQQPPSNALTDLMMDANITITYEALPTDESADQATVDDEEEDLMNELHIGQFNSDEQPLVDQSTELPPQIFPVVLEVVAEDQPEPEYVPEPVVDLDSDLLQIASESAARTFHGDTSDNDEPEEVVDSSSSYSEDDDDDIDDEEDADEIEMNQGISEQAPAQNYRPTAIPLHSRSAVTFRSQSPPIEIDDDDEDEEVKLATEVGLQRGNRSSSVEDDNSYVESSATDDEDSDRESPLPPKPIRKRQPSGELYKKIGVPSFFRRRRITRPRTIREKLKKKSVSLLNRKMHVRMEQLSPVVATHFGPAVDKPTDHIFDQDQIINFVTGTNVAPPSGQPIFEMPTTAPKVSIQGVAAAPPADDDDSDDVEMIEDSPEVSPVKQNIGQANVTAPNDGNSIASEAVKVELFVPQANSSEPQPKETEVVDVSAEPECTTSIAESVEVKSEPPILVEESNPITTLPTKETRQSEPQIESKTNEVKVECVETVMQVVVQEKPPGMKNPTQNAETNIPSTHRPEDQSVVPTTSSRKRARSVSPVCDQVDESVSVPPSKRLCAELERNFGQHDKTLREYIDKTANNSLDEVHRHLEQLKEDIAHLDELSAAKEQEWNNILHLKKCKEEIVLRLSRRKTVMEIMAGKMGDMPTGSEDNAPPTLDKRMARELKQAVEQDAQNHHGSSSCLPTSQSILASRANMKTDDLAKEKANTTRLHRNILPKPAAPPTSSGSPGLVLLSQSHSTSSSPILNSYINSGPTPVNVDLTTTSAVATNPSRLNAQQQLQLQLQQYQQHQQQQQHNQAINELLMNGAAGHHNTMASGQIGRQGPIKDVRSIIDDHRQKHPEQVPRRGRRRRGSPSPPNHDISFANSSGHNLSAGLNAGLAPGKVSMKDFLIELAKVTQERLNTNHSQSSAHSPRRQSIDLKNTSTPIMKAALGYPEVTLHPVSMSMQDSANQLSVPGGASAASPTSHSNSLLHGILTKNTRPQPSTAGSPNNVTNAGFTSFSPTLARLLTAPERNAASFLPVPLAGHNLSNNNNSYHGKPEHGMAAAQMGGIVNLAASKPAKSEITITPVVNSMSHSLQHTLIQNQLEQHQQQRLQSRMDASSFMRSKHDMSGLDDEADDSVDRLVIDEGSDDHHHHQQQQQQNVAAAAALAAAQNAAHDFHDNDVPECQGCKKREAQFVCAGCSNQWYCSRSCQVSAWDEHSDVCTG